MKDIGSKTNKLIIKKQMRIEWITDDKNSKEIAKRDKWMEQEVKKQREKLMEACTVEEMSHCESVRTEHQMVAVGHCFENAGVFWDHP